jgi:molybdopterin-guanine dinucleotide biosynthesis protein A
VSTQVPDRAVTSTVLLEVTGVVLAGGSSRRMGQDKAFLDLEGRPMIGWVLDALRPACREVLIVAKTPDLYRGFDARVVEDEAPEQAALIGLCTGLRAAATAHVFAAACDLPFLSTAVVSWMCGLTSGVDAVVPRVDGQWHPLHAVYARSALPVLETRSRTGAWALAGALAGLRVRTVEASELDTVDPGHRSIRNINTMAEYEMLIAHGA